MDEYSFSGEYQSIINEINTLLHTDLAKDAFQLVKKDATEFWDYLIRCEQCYLDGSYTTADYSHDMENMLALYTLNHVIPLELTNTLKEYYELPPSKISQDKLSLDSILDGFVAGDGTLYAFSKYCQLDPLWMLVLVYYFLYKYIIPGEVHPFVTKPSNMLIDLTLPSAKIAVLGDWGTGKWKDGKEAKCAAQLVIEGITSLNPDYIIHLGDVYYAGTRKEEQEHLLALLPDDFRGKLYTMNSNHEMYDGANGLFKVAISDPRFGPQRGRTYFSIEIGEWVLVGLDSAYYDESALYMDGAIHSKKGGQEQAAFLSEKAKLGKKLMLFTHHNGIEYDASKLNDPLWGQICSALDGKTPDVWYWGHVHNGIVYKDTKDALPILKGVTSIHGNVPKLRCCGHASIPFGNGTGLYKTVDGVQETIAPVEYYTHTPLNAPHSTPSQHLRVLNGFAMLEINGSDLTETFYEVSNQHPKPKAVWTK